MATKSSKPFHVQVAELLIARMKEGTAPWQKPWKAGDPFLFMPMNPTTGKRYKGINAMYLMAQGRTDQRWLTYNQAQAIGAQVRKGESGTPIQYWKFSEEQIKRDEAGKPIKDEKGEYVKVTVMLERPRVFFATVFNAEQIDGMPPLQLVARDQTWTPLERAEQILKASGASIHHSEQDRAFYRPSTDKIHMPEKHLFPSADNYYATALHELGHWTGHESRLDRDLANPFGSEAYAREELRAEIASMILGNELGIGHDPDQHASYVKSWIKVLEEDPMEIFRAAADAEKIHEFVLAFEQKQVQSQEQDQPAPAVDPLSVDIQTVMASPENSFAHFASYRGAEQGLTLEQSLRREGFNTVRDVVGIATRNDANTMYATANDRLSRVFGITPSHWQTDNAYLERKGLTDAFFAVAERIVMQQPKTLPAPQPGRLADSLQKIGMSQGDAFVTSARRDLLVATVDTLAVDQAAFSDSAMAAFGFTLPADWSGEVQVEGKISKGDEVISAAQVNADPEFFGVYARTTDGTHTWLADAATQEQAKDLESRLLLVDAYSQPNTFNRDAKLARLQEQWVNENPNSTEQEKAHAREIRKLADAALLVDAAPAVQQATPAADVPAPAQSTKAERTYIKVDYRDRHEPKALGARWDKNENLWYVPPGKDLAAFEKWPVVVPASQALARQASTPQAEAAPIPTSNGDTIKATQTAPQAVEDTGKAIPSKTAAAPAKELEQRQYLAVDYHQRGKAKAAGAMWDATAKSWYAGPNADMDKLKQWLPEAVAVEQAPALTPREEFADALRAAGFVIPYTLTGADDEHPIMDGTKQRVAVEGDKGGAKSGFYVGHMDGHPAGFYMNNKTGHQDKWKSKGYTLSEEQKAVMQAEAAQKLQARAEDERRRHEQSAARVVGQLANVKPAQADTPYIAAKGIEAHPGVFVDRDNKTMFIPAFDVQGKQWTMQYIQEDGTKRFAKDSRKDGCFHPVGGMEALKAAPAFVIGEGYATAAQVAEAVGFATVAAFDSGNLEAVAKALHEAYPDKPVIIVGDDDRHLVMTHGTNPGRSKAEAAAQAVGGKAVFPIFASSEVTYPASLPPITQDAYKAHLAAEQRLADAAAGKATLKEGEADMLKDSMLSAAQLAALAHMKKHTDFNDLATKSSLGRDGVERQMKAAVDWAIEKHVSRAEQEQVQQQEQNRTQRHERKRAATI
jgi:putative DNA primase/helicase